MNYLQGTPFAPIWRVGYTNSLYATNCAPSNYYYKQCLYDKLCFFMFLFISIFLQTENTDHIYLGARSSSRRVPQLFEMQLDSK